MDTIQYINCLCSKINGLQPNHLRLLQSEEFDQLLLQHILQQAEKYYPTQQVQEDDISSYMTYQQDILIVVNDPNFPPIPTTKSAFDPTISDAYLHLFKPFFASHRAILSIFNFNSNDKIIENTFPAQSRCAIWA